MKKIKLETVIIFIVVSFIAVTLTAVSVEAFSDLDKLEKSY